MIAIIGSGIVGRSWAIIFAKANFTVRMFDINSEQLESASDFLKNYFEQNSFHRPNCKKSTCHFEQNDYPDLFKNISFTDSLESAVKDSIYVQECVPENLELKRKIFEQLDTLTEKTIILASSTSNIAPSKFTESLENRQRCLVAHPINPPFLIPLVEIVPSTWTDQTTISMTKKLLHDAGQKPVVLKKEVDGFLVNRLQYALLAEAFRLVEDGIADPDDIDSAISCGLGLRWSILGPFQTIDLNAPNGVSDYCERYKESIYRVLKTQDNSREWKQGTINKINDSLRNQYPLHQIQYMTEQRNQKLMSLSKIKKLNNN